MDISIWISPYFLAKQISWGQCGPNFCSLVAKIGPFHLNDLKCFKSRTCSVESGWTSGWTEVGERNGRCIWMFFFEIEVLANWMLASNCMCKWAIVTGVLGCMWIFGNIFPGNLFVAKKVVPLPQLRRSLAASSQGKIQWAAHTQLEKHNIPVPNQWNFYVKQVLVESNWYKLYSEHPSIFFLLVGWNYFVSYLYLDEFMEIRLLMWGTLLFHETHKRTITCCLYINYITLCILTRFIPKTTCYLYRCKLEHRS